MDADLPPGRRPLFVSRKRRARRTAARSTRCRSSPISAAERGVWFHVDAAYGGFAVLDERGRQQLAGIELADSITLDPHKWLYQPYECGCLLVRDGARFGRAFLITPDYLREATALDRRSTSPTSACSSAAWPARSRSGSRSSTSAWTRSGARSRARSTSPSGPSERIEESDRLELAARPRLGIVSFRRVFDEDEEPRLNARLVAALEESGLGLVSSTRLKGRYTIRMCVMSHTSGERGRRPGPRLSRAGRRPTGDRRARRATSGIPTSR